MRLSRSLCKVVGDIIYTTGSHASLESLFHSAGAPGVAPTGPHSTRWKEWLYLIGQDPGTDSLAALGGIIEEFMDISPPAGSPEFVEWSEKRKRIESVLHDNNLRYYRFGHILPVGHIPVTYIAAEENVSSFHPRHP